MKVKAFLAACQVAVVPCAWWVAVWLWLQLGGALQRNDSSARAVLRLKPGSVALLVTAHPDDEAMFFAPSVAALVAFGVNVHVLCLSTGNADGLGALRARELPAACAVLGVPPSCVHLLDDPQLQDGRQHWPPGLVADTLDAVVSETRAAVVITFDEHGISSHANHIATHHGVLTWARRRHRLRDCWFLQSYRSPLKFSGVMSAPLAMGAAAMRPRALAVFLTASPELAARALACHASQLVWYRVLFLAFAQCCCINTLQQHTAA